MSINELFGTTNEINRNARSLEGTAELTSYASRVASNILKTMEADIDTYRPRIQQSATDSKLMDELLNEFKPYEEISEDDMLRHLDEKTVDGILKSQQSKRSRAKGRVMTLDNYINLMTAAIAENTLRELYNLGKSNRGFGRAAAIVDYTGAQLEALAADQEALRKEIRNVQSKKSIMKSKTDFNESDERWLSLLKAEQQLKDLRVSHTQVIEVDSTKNALANILAETDISKLNSKDAHALLESISNMVQK